MFQTNIVNCAQQLLCCQQDLTFLRPVLTSSLHHQSFLEFTLLHIQKSSIHLGLHQFTVREKEITSPCIFLKKHTFLRSSVLPSDVGVFYFLYVDVEALGILLIRACLPCTLWQDTCLISSVFPEERFQKLHSHCLYCGSCIVVVTWLLF